MKEGMKMKNDSFFSELSRREFLTITRNLTIATVAGGMLMPARPLWAAPVKASLGNFGSANPQTFGKATGSFQKALGADVQITYVPIDSGAQVVTTIAGGSLDLCNAGSMSIVVAYANGVKLKMVYIEKYITDSECLVVRQGKGIKKLEDLRGRYIALPFNTSVHYAMLAALDTVRMTNADVKLIDMKPDAIVAAWKRKDIDATFIWIPVLIHCLADGGEIMMTTADLQKHGVLAFDGIACRDEFNANHPDLVLAYLKEYDRICKIYTENPEEVVSVMSKYIGIAPEISRAYVKSFHPLTPKEMATKKWMGLPGDKDTGLLKTLRGQAEFLKSAGQLTKMPESFEPVVDASFLAKMI
jgi:taurine transport system substrate-binding protein